MCSYRMAMIRVKWSCKVVLVEGIDGVDLAALTSFTAGGLSFANPRHILLESDSSLYPVEE